MAGALGNIFPGAGKATGTRAAKGKGPGIKGPKVNPVSKAAGLPKPNTAPVVAIGTSAADAMKPLKIHTQHFNVAKAEHRQAQLAKKAKVKGFNPETGTKVATAGLSSLGPLGAIGSFVGKEAGKAASEAVHMPEQVGQGALQVGSAAVHDVTHPLSLHGGAGDVLGAVKAITNPGSVLAGNNPGGGQLGKDVISSVRADPIVNTVITKGKIHAPSVKSVVNDPLGTALDLTAVGGAAGRAVGALERASKGAEALSGSQRINQLIKGADAADVGKYSKNYFKARVQAHLDMNPRGLAAKGAHAAQHPIESVHSLVKEGDINPRMLAALRRVDQNVHLAQGTAFRTEHELDKALKNGAHAKLPKIDQTHHNIVADLRVGGVPKTVEGARTKLENLRDSFQTNLHSVPDTWDQMHVEDHIHNIQKALDANNHEQMAKALQHALHHSTQAELADQYRTIEGLSSPEQRGLQDFALQHGINGKAVKIVTDPKEADLTERAYQAREISREAKAARAEVQAIREGKHPDLKSYSRQVTREVKKAETKVKNAEKKVQYHLGRTKGSTTDAKNARLLLNYGKHEDAIQTYKLAKSVAPAAIKAKKAELLDEARPRAQALSELERQTKHLRNEKLMGTLVQTTPEEIQNAIEGGLPAHELDVTSGWRRLHPSEVHAEMNRIGYEPNSAAYMSHTRPPQPHEIGTGVKVPNRSLTTRGGGKGPINTGEALKTGLYSGTGDSSKASILKQLQSANKASAFDKQLEDFGIKNPETPKGYWRMDTPAERSKVNRAITKYAAENNGEQLVPVAVRPANMPEEEASALTIANRQHANLNPENIHEQRYLLMPQKIIDRTIAHENVRQVPVLSHASNLFRGTVLPYSANYYMSVMQEGLVRGAVHGISPRTKALKTLMGHYHDIMVDPHAAPDVRAVARDRYEQFSVLSGQGTNIGLNVQDLHDTLLNPHASEGAVKTAAKKFLSTMAKPMELAHKAENFQTKAVMDTQIRKLVKDVKQSGESMNDTLKRIAETGKVDSNQMAKMQNDINEVLGRYMQRSPVEREIIRNAAPFWPWLSNAYHFMYITLPVDHPILNNFLQKVGAANAQAWSQEHAGDAAYEKDFLPTSLGGIDVLRNTPAGATEGGPANQAASAFTLLTPQFSPVQHAMGLNGYFAPNWSVTSHPGTVSGATLKDAGLNAAQTFIPGVAPISKIVKGPTSSANLSKSILGRIENELVPGAMIPRKGGSSSSSSSSSAGLPSGVHLTSGSSLPSGVHIGSGTSLPSGVTIH